MKIFQYEAFYCLNCTVFIMLVEEYYLVNLPFETHYPDLGVRD
jgi:hypothetical protein